jgi:hypothetical protein
LLIKAIRHQDSANISKTLLIFSKSSTFAKTDAYDENAFDQSIDGPIGFDTITVSEFSYSK